MRRRPRGRRLLRLALWAILIALLLPMPFVIAYRFVPPPITPLMMIRWIGGAPINQHWVPLDRISATLPRAVISSEDEKFCTHHGFDWTAFDNAYRAWRAGREPKGASTITMQVAKNLFLWPGRSVIRKGIEAYVTVLLEFFWNKHRIMEVYLNVIEWGDGVYGAEAASRYYFKKSASNLSPAEAAYLSAMIPSPLNVFNPQKNPKRVTRRQRVILRFMNSIQLKY